MVTGTSRAMFSRQTKTFIGTPGENYVVEMDLPHFELFC
jgi:hypothetical protein